MAILHKFWRWTKRDNEGNILENEFEESILKEDAPPDVVEQHKDFYEKRRNTKTIPYEEVLKLLEEE